MKMNPKIKARWVAALRSGEYKQGQHQLRTADNRFCCLGVLCNLHAQDHPEIARQQRDVRLYMERYGNPHPEVYKWARLSADGFVRINGRYRHLAQHNDAGATFTQIAKAIEEQL